VRIAEVRQQPVALVARHVAVEPVNDLFARAQIRAHHLPQIFGVEPFR
jgi:hypothetical protein